MEFTFEKSPWEQLVDSLEAGNRISAMECLRQIQDLSGEEAEAVLLELSERYDISDVTDLPQFAQDEQTMRRLKLERKLVKSGELMTGLDENDPLRLFLEEVAAMSAAGDEKQLLAQFSPDDEETTQKLAYLSLHRVVERACVLAGLGVVLLDLIQEGCLGLWQGILSYTGGDYEAHIYKWIDRYLTKAVLLQSHDKQVIYKVQQGMADYRDMDQRLLSELGRNPTLEEIAEAMHTTAEEAVVYAEMLRQARTKEQRLQMAKPAEKTPEDEQAVENTAYFQTRQRIMELLSTLTEQEAKLLTLRFGLEGGLPKSPQQTGEVMGLTADEVVQIEAAALAKLRQQGE